MNESPVERSAIEGNPNQPWCMCCVVSLSLSSFSLLVLYTMCMHIVHYIVFEAARVRLHSPRQCASETGWALLYDDHNTHHTNTYRSSLFCCVVFRFISKFSCSFHFASLRFVSFSCIQQPATARCVCASLCICIVYSTREGAEYKRSAGFRYTII